MIEELEGSVEATEAQVDHAEKRLRLTRNARAGSFRDLRRPRTSFDRIVLALGPLHATTVEGTVRVKRQSAERTVDESELDALVFKGLWEFLNRHRSWVAKKMGVSDLDLVLAHIEIRDVRLGTHRLLNPLGFKGGDLFITFRGTFVPRSLTPLLERFRLWGTEVVALERGATLAASVAEPEEFFAFVHEGGTAVFSSQDGERLRLRELPWGVAKIHEAIAAQFGVPIVTATLILERAAQGGASEQFGRVLDRTLKEEFGHLIDLIYGVVHRAGERSRRLTHVHVRSLVPGLAALEREPHLKVVHFDEALRALGFDLAMSGRVEGFNPAVHQELLALLAYPYAHPHYAFLNQLLKRRAKWLIPHPNES